jgi:hypothetical protein
VPYTGPTKRQLGKRLSKSSGCGQRIGPLTDAADGMTSYEQRPYYRDPRHGGPDRLLMFLVLSFIGMMLLRAFVLFN